MLMLIISLFLLQPLWITFEDANHRFKIFSPGELVHSVDTINAPIGSIIYHNYHFICDEEWELPGVFQVSYYSSPGLLIPSDSTMVLDEFFEATVDQSASTLGGEVIFSDSLQYEGIYPGRLWRIHYNEGASVMKSRAFLVDDTFYSIQVAVEANHSLDEKIDQFLESFRILDSP